jgi:plasmid stabilization system protein ParE
MQFPVVAPDLRRALVPKFPYGIFFRVLETKIVVIAVLHLHRHPETWRSRE